MKSYFKKPVLFFALLIIGFAQGQSNHRITEKILSNWQGGGKLFGQEATFSMKWENDLNNKFLKLSFKNSFIDDSSIERVMKANAYYRLNEGKGYWFDTRGMMLPLNLEVNENSIVVLWGDEETEMGKTIYSAIDNDQIRVQDFVLKDNAFIPFGEAVYTRATN